ncbi:MAG: hypothetical protein HYX32_11405 [Actinobacteria bacterium]|nr:hypothetical protein [Actinomycetota bacterium]
MRAATDPRTRRASRWIVIAIVTSVVLVSIQAAPASASPIVEANSVALDISATCERGNVNINYTTGGSIDRQTVNFTSGTGTVLDTFESDVYGPTYDGTEYILTKAGSQRGGGQAQPPAGTILAVYVTLGAAPPVATNAEFFLLYRCDVARNDRGGQNTVLDTCVGDYGTCPKTAQEALAAGSTTTQPAASPTTQPASNVSAPAAVVAVPRFTG